MTKTLHPLIESLSLKTISDDRKADFSPLIQYIKGKRKNNHALHLNFICTHNSRRSQLSQLWAKVMGHYHNINISTCSGGVEVTACNKRIIAALHTQGFSIKQFEESNNPVYHINWGGVSFGTYFSKLYDHESNPKKNFAAVMTCADADENCPFIPGAEQRIPLRYEDPKRYDDTENEAQAYLDKSVEIATEMHYIFSSIK